MTMLLYYSLLSYFTAAASAGSLTDIKHVVLFMQENRAFDHYFGTMAGVRGFADPNVQINADGKSVFQQIVTANMSKKAEHLTPWYLNYLGGDWLNATQCMVSGSNSWVATHESYNGGLNNKWATWNTPWSWAYFKRSDLPTHFDVADGWTVLDMYQEGVLAATDPNRITWMSGTVNNPGTPNNPDGSGGMMLDNAATPGCEYPKRNLNCFPLTWKTNPEYWQDAGATWQVYQDKDNFEDNMLPYFKQYQEASKNADDPLTKYGNSYNGLQSFYDDAAAGTLPMISVIIGPAELAEHPPYMPHDGAFLVKKVVDAVTSGAAYNQTALIISYDEPGGFGDHVVPFHAPKGTAGEWIDDPYEIFGETPVGPGFRIPAMIVSPWTRGGYVFTEHADHNSQTMFVEEWLTAQGYKNVQQENITPWRRAHMSNLVNAFDFSNPDYSVPNIASVPTPLRNWNAPATTDGPLGSLDGNYVGTTKCLDTYNITQPPVPYGPDNENANMTLQTEEGFKQVRGDLTEGRFLVFEQSGKALAAVNGMLSATAATDMHNDIAQRWVLHVQGEADSNIFKISSAVDNRFIAPDASLTSDESQAATITISDLGNGQGYYLAYENGVLSMDSNGAMASSSTSAAEDTTGFAVYSVTYHS